MAGKSIHSQLLDGLEVKSRADGSVHTVKAEGKVVAEICVGTRKTRVNFREAVKAPKGVELIGKSKTWAGGGLVVDDSNVAKVRAILAQLVKPAPAKPAAKRTRSTAKAA